MKYFTINNSPGTSLALFFAENSNRKQLIKQIMRIGFLSLVIVLTTMQLLVALPVKSQKISSVEVRLELRNETLLTAFKKIEQQTPFRFVYRKGELVTLPARTLSSSTYTVEQVLNMLLEDTDLSYKQVDNNVLIQTSTVRPERLDKSEEIVTTLADIIKGQVTDTRGETLPGVSIKIKGTTVGATSDLDGRYTINVPNKNSVLVFTYIGYVTQEQTVNDRTTLNVKMEAANTALTEVVVTAFGLSRDKKALAYSVTEVKGEEFTTSRENNIANAFSGKVAGVNVTGMSSGPGGSSRVIIRGNGSLSGNNQPLYVVNGMPISNIARSQAQGEGATILDRGDGISSINPDDIESISILKGGPAAALYGSQASNGVILITTKKGAVQKGVGVEIGSNFTVGSPSMYPDLQYEYGQGLD
jgi:TonB-dependent SusC/RagA subfamily outer membrane receptor